MRPGYEVVRGFVPPHVLEAMAEHSDKQVRAAALEAIGLTARLSTQRELLGATLAAVPAGELRRTIYDMKHLSLTFFLPGVRVRGEGEPESGDEAVDEAYDSLGDTYTFYNKVFGRNSIDDRGMRLDASVHFGRAYPNAFWNGRQMVFGDGDGTVFVGFTHAIDVIAHELTHGVTQYMADLAYHDEPGALNESFSDVFGSLVKQYVLKQDAAAADWLIGQGILGPTINGVALRSMKAPGTAYDDKALGGKDPQPAHMSQYIKTTKDNGGVHFNSGIPNHAFYLVATELGGNAWEEAGTIWYETLRQLWSKAKFADCARVTFQVAGEKFGPGGKAQQAVRKAWSEVGIEVAPVRVAAKRRERVPAASSNGSELKQQLERLTEELRRTAELLSKTVEVMG